MTQDGERRMERGLSFSVEATQDTVAVEFSGRLSEYAQLEEVADQLPAGCSLVLDVGGIRRLNSIGVRKWIEFMEQCRRHCGSIEIRNCPEAFVSQVNTVSGFAHGREIASVFAPYLCESCGAEKDVLIDVSERLGITLPEPVCDHDAEPMIFDDLEEVYFGFLQRL